MTREAPTMTTNEIATLNMIDEDSGEEAVAIVRTVGGAIALCLSLESNGDVEVVMKPRDCERLLAALREAVSAATVPH
jgi:hypothetical protein